MIPDAQRELMMLSHGQLWINRAATPAITIISMGRLFHEVPIRRVKAPHGALKILRDSRDR